MSRLIGGLVCCGLALLTSARVQVWQSDRTLWADAQMHAPFKPRPAINLGVALLVDHRYSDAEQWLKEGLRLADVRPTGEQDRARDLALANLAVARLQQGDIAGAQTFVSEHEHEGYASARSLVAARYGLGRTGPRQ